ncbi:hypothetical protein SLA2020_165650 [Shorea laevis]
MARKLNTLLVLLLVFSCLPFVFPLSLNYPAVFNFGDSNSDTGGLVAGKGFRLGLPYGKTFFNSASGRFCDGRLIIDFLMDDMNLSFLNPILDSVGAPDFQNGCNFATGGATIRPANAAAQSPFSFNVQVAQFIRFKARALEFLSKDTELEGYLPTEEIFSQALYMFDVGQNDLDGAFYSKSEDEVIALIPTLLSALAYGIENLYPQGARNFWIHNMGPLGCLPRIINPYRKDSSKLDQFGCVASHNRAVNYFNMKLHDLCINLRQELPEANVTYVDIYSIKINLIANYSQYGFEQPIAACCGYGGPPLNFDSRIACGVTKSLNSSTVTANPCDNPAVYVNWDGNHYTEAANLFVFQQILSGNYSDPPPPANQTSFLAGLEVKSS